MVVLFQQNAEKRDFFSNFSADGLHDGGTLLVMPLEFQEIKHQPFPVTQPQYFGRPRSVGGKALCKRLCSREWLMLFSLKLQRDNRKNALAVAPAKGKTGKKALFFNALWR